MSGRRIRGLKTTVERKCCISRRGPSCTVDVYKLKESKEEVTVLSPEEAGSNSKSESCQEL